MKKITAVIMLLIFAVSAFCSCSSSDSIVLFFAVKEKAGSFDPQIVSDDTASIVVGNCFEGLLRLDENGNTVNGAAKNYTVSPDGLTYTFYLRTDAKWHLTSNAQKQLEKELPENFDLSVTAYDFRFALIRAVDPATNSKQSHLLGNILNAKEISDGTLTADNLGVKAIDKYTLEITLSQPQSNFEKVLTQPVCMPCNETFFEACSGRYGTLIAFSLSNGPFYLSRFDDTSYRLNKAADYVGESEAVPDYIWLYVDNDKDSLITSLKENEYSGAVISDNIYSSLKITKKMTVVECPDVLCCFIMNPKDEVFCENGMRMALASATDVSNIALSAERAAAEGFVPICAADKTATHPNVYSEENAVAYLKSGLNKLGVQSVNVTLKCEEKYEDAMKKQLQEWQRILGISVNFTVETSSENEIKSAYESGNYQLIFYPLQAGADSAYEYFASLPIEFYGVPVQKDIEDTLSDKDTSNEQKDTPASQDENAPTKEYILSLTDSMNSSTDEHYKETYKELESRLAASSVMLPVWNENSYFVCTENVKNVLYFSSNDSLYFHKATNKK